MKNAGFRSCVARSRVCPEDGSIFMRVTQQFEKYADDLTLARWLEEARERPLSDSVRRNALEQALALYRSLNVEWHMIRRCLESLIEIDPSDHHGIQMAVDEAEGVGDDGAISRFLTIALDNPDAAQLTDLIKLRWMRRLAEVHDAHGDLSQAIERNRAILQEWPLDDDAFQGLRRAYHEVGDYIALAETLRVRINLLESNSGSREMNLRTEWAELHASRLGDRDAAIAALMPVLDDQSLDARAAELLMGLFVEEGDPLGQIRVLECGFHEANEHERASLVQRMHQVLDALEHSLDLRERVLLHERQLDHSAVGPLQRLADIYRQRDDQVRLLDMPEQIWQLQPVDENAQS